MKNRRTKEGYRLRVYLETIKQVKEMTDEQWVTQWASQDSGERFVSRTMWLSYLEQCAIKEAERFMITAEAA